MFVCHFVLRWCCALVIERCHTNKFALPIKILALAVEIVVVVLMLKAVVIVTFLLAAAAVAHPYLPADIQVLHLMFKSCGIRCIHSESGHVWTAKVALKTPINQERRLNPLTFELANQQQLWEVELTPENTKRKGRIKCLGSALQKREPQRKSMGPTVKMATRWASWDFSEQTDI